MAASAQPAFFARPERDRLASREIRTFRRKERGPSRKDSLIGAYGRVGSGGEAEEHD